MSLTFDRDNPSPGEGVREFYRKQGEAREQERILRELAKLAQYREDATWSPSYIMKIVKRGEL